MRARTERFNPVSQSRQAWKLRVRLAWLSAAGAPFAFATLTLWPSAPRRLASEQKPDQVHNEAGSTAKRGSLAPLRTPPHLPAPSLSYQLNVRLDATSKRITGDGEIQFKNSSRHELKTLWFHLYFNAFKNNRTLFSRSPFSSGRSGGKPRRWGYIDITKLDDMRTGESLWGGAAAHSPGDPEDETDIEVPLRTPLKPGDTISLSVSWESQLPEIVERTGYSDDYFFVGQWFPKLAKFVADDGDGRAVFRHFAFHPQAEFHADFADYTVTIDVPDEMRVGATGEKKHEHSAQGRTTLEFEARSVHDFAWTAWQGFDVSHERIGDVDVRLMFPFGHRRNREKTLDALRFALPHFEALYGRYPYATLTVIHPPPGASNSGGMEYPTLITTGGSWRASLYSRAIELVTIHELAHQWFYGLLASNESRWPFLDEGFASYAEAQAITELFGTASAAKVLDIRFSADAVRRASAAALALDAPVSQSAAEFPSFGHLGALAYNRTATLLTTLEAQYGSRFVELMRAYTLKFRFSHPEPEDFLELAERHLGSGAAQLTREALFERAFVDYVVSSVETAPATKKLGVFGRGEGRTTVSVETPEPEHHVGNVLVVRRGTLKFPVDIDLHDAEGGIQRVNWDGLDPFIEVEYSGRYPLVGAVVDPDGKLPLDQNLLNNSYFVENRWPTRTLERVTYVGQLLLHLLGP